MNLLRLFRQSLFSPGAACKRTLARNTRRLLPLAAALLFAATAQAQERRTTHDNDFRARFSFALTKQLGQRHSITLDEELRLKDNWSQLDRIYTTLSYAYDVRPWFKAAAFYALIANDRGADRSMEMRHRFYLELTASYKTGAWNFSLRERPQATLHTAYVDPAVAAKTAWVLRHRLMAEYAVAGTGLKPYVFVELTQTLNAPETVGNYLEKVRSSLGAKYAFNKSHAAAYAFVSYQTAWLKYYYPVEFMAALMTSCIDNPGKVAEYILSSRQMGISILPPDINRSEGKFTVDGQAIRYGMAAVKGIGKPVMEAIVEERSANGPFRSLKDFAERLSGKEVNKRTVENFIKAGAFDCFGVTRKQLMFVYANVLDDVAREKKDSLSGQMSLFDFVDETTKRSYETVYPDVGEYEKSDLLALEKEVLGIYVSGHPLEEQEECWRKNISAVTTDFQPDEETGFPSVTDGAKEIVGGIITDKKIKYTKNNKTMAFLTLEDLVGSMEIVVFPRDYEKNAAMMQTDARVFIQGRVSAEDDKPSKLICEKIFPFAGIPKELWIQFPDKETYEREVADLYQMLHESDGKDSVILYIKSIKAMKKLPPSRNVQADARLVASLQAKFGTGNVKVVEKSIEKRA